MIHLLAQYLKQASFFGTEEAARLARIEGIVKELDAGIQSMRDDKPLPADEVLDELRKAHGLPIPEKDPRLNELRDKAVSAIHEYGMYGRTRERKRILASLKVD